jgi:hypothetical protein
MEVAACCVSTAPLGVNKTLLPIDENPSRHCNELSGGFRSGEAEQTADFWIFRRSFTCFLETQPRETRLTTSARRYIHPLKQLLAF